MAEKNKRENLRHAFDTMVTVSWQDGEGRARFLRARGIDFSNLGARIESDEPIEARSKIYIRAEQYGLAGSASVRHCTKRGSKYLLGLGLDAAGPGVRPATDAFIDYYEMFQISPKAEMETIHRVFRMLASRYHPDNRETGDSEKFLRLSRIYETLTDPARRAAYDALYQLRQSEPNPVFEMKEFVVGLEGEPNRRLGILCLLHKRRRTNPDRAGLSVLQMENLMLFPREHLAFTIGYLKEKEYIRQGSNSDYEITAAGMDYVEARIARDHVLGALLSAPMHREEYGKEARSGALG